MYYLLFTIYLAAACFFIRRISFVKNSGLPVKLVIALFLVKIFAGILIGWVSQKFYPQGSDYWDLNDSGWLEYHWMLSDPGAFFKDLYISHHEQGYGGFFDSTASYWNDLRNNIIVKLLAVCNFFSRGNYYINSLFFNFIGFYGHIALFRIFIDIYKNKKWPVVIGCFLLPSALYFSSGIHKDLFVFTMLGLYCYALYFSLQKKFTANYLAVMFFSILALLFIRNFVAIALIPATIALILCKKVKLNSVIVFTGTYIFACLFLFLLQVLKPSFQPAKIVSDKQRDFLDLPYSASQFDIHPLEPTYTSLIRNTPAALTHSLLRPSLFGSGSETKFMVPLAVELFIYQVLFLIMLIFYQKNIGGSNNFVIFSIFVALSLLLFTGYIAPNTGSIVRYRSLYLPFLITPILCHINWRKLGLS